MPRARRVRQDHRARHRCGRGANLASISYHFGSKEALLNQALLRASAHWVAHLSTQALTDDGKDHLARSAAIYQIVTGAVTESSTYPGAFLEAIAHAASSAPLRAQLAEHYGAMRHLIAGLMRHSLTADAQRQGADPEVLAAFLVAMCDGFAIQTLLDPDHVPDAHRLIDTLNAAFCVGHESHPRGK